MSFNPLVSIIIPYYKHEQFLPATVRSVLDQTYKNLEVVVVYDRGPSPPAQEVLKDFPQDRLRIITQEQKSTAAQARNVGVKHATGEFVLPVDSDDLLVPTYLEKTVPFLENPDVCGVYTAVQMFGDSDEIYAPEWDVSSIITGAAGPLICVLFRKSMFEAVGGYNGSWRVGEDSDLILKAFKRGGKFIRVEEPLYLYRRHGEATTAVQHERNLMELAELLAIHHKDTMYEHLEEVVRFKEERYWKLWEEYRHLHTEFHKLLELYTNLEQGQAKAPAANRQILSRLKSKLKRTLLKG